MTWRQKTIARILLIIAIILADEPQLAEALRRLATEIQVNAPKPGDA